MSTWDEWCYRNESNTADELTEVLIQNQEYGHHADINSNGEPKYYPSNWSHRRLSSPGLFNPSKVNAESLDSIKNVTESSSETITHSTLALHRDSIQLAAKRYKNDFRSALVRSSLISIDETHDHYGSQWFHSTASCVFEKGSRKLSTLLNLTPVHGHIINNAKGKNKIFWIIILILAAVGLLYEIINVTRQYVQTPTATEVNSEALRGIKFPTIVICSLNPLNKTWLRDESVPLDLALYAQHVYMSTKNDVSPRMNISEKPNLSQALEDLVSKLESQDLREFFLEGGYQCEEMLHTCIFQWHPYNCCALVKPVFDIHFGKCFKLDADWVQYYPAAGLQLKLNIHRQLYVPRFASPSIGVAVRILKEYDPSATEYAYISPGKHIAIQLEELTQTYVNTMNKRHCDDGLNDRHYNVTSLPYTQNQCISYCFNDAALRTCNCMYPQDSALYAKLSHVPRICLPNETVNCIIPKVENDIKVHDCAKDCLPECTQTQYRMSISMADLTKDISKSGFSEHRDLSTPVGKSVDKNGNFVPYVKRVKSPKFRLNTGVRRRQMTWCQLVSEGKNDCKSKTTEDNINDYINLDIFFSKIQRTHIQEVLILTVDNLISQIGGLMGMFLGVSLITAIQLCIMGAEFVKNSFCGKNED